MQESDSLKLKQKCLLILRSIVHGMPENQNSLLKIQVDIIWFEKKQPFNATGSAGRQRSKMKQEVMLCLIFFCLFFFVVIIESD